MRITSSNVGMESARSYYSYMTGKISTAVMVGTKGLLSDEKAGENAKQEEGTKAALATFWSIHAGGDKKNELRQKLNEMSSYSSTRQIAHLQKSRDSYSTVKDRCMQYLVAIFFGETKKFDYEELALSVQGRGATGVTETVYYEKETYYEEQEDTTFSTKGTVCTGDGRQIDFGLHVEMSRSFSAYYKENYTQIQTRMCDPLVINLEGDVAELEDQTFYFDIDADGTEDEIAALGKGSGYLALDKNKDGVINDGSELFGAHSGNGFADLAAYDSDGNGWIDEGDEIWSKLLIWTKDESGRDKCYTLKEKGVGAICLSNTDTDFSLNSEKNIPNGRIRRTGIFLYENGLAGTVQHLDVAKHDNYV